MAKTKTKHTDKAITDWLNTVQSTDADVLLEKIRELCRAAYAKDRDARMLPTQQQLMKALNLGFNKFKSLVADLETGGKIRCIQTGRSLRFIPSEMQ